MGNQFINGFCGGAVGHRNANTAEAFNLADAKRGWAPRLE